jgi:hypothetical protein
MPVLTRVLIWGVPELLYGILSRECSREPDLRVIAPRKFGLTLLEAVEADLPDVVIVGESANALEQACEHILRAFPQLRVITLRNDGREAYLCRLTLKQTLLGELSLPSLVTAIRQCRASDLAGSQKY